MTQIHLISTPTSPSHKISAVFFITACVLFTNWYISRESCEKKKAARQRPEQLISNNRWRDVLLIHSSWEDMKDLKYGFTVWEQVAWETSDVSYFYGGWCCYFLLKSNRNLQKIPLFWRRLSGIVWLRFSCNSRFFVRTFSVFATTSRQTPRHFHVGMPQSSVQGPILFLFPPQDN